MTTQARKRDGIFLPKIQLNNEINIKEASAFLNVLDSDATQFSFQAFDDSTAKRTELVAIRHGSLEECANWLIKQNKQGAGVFVTINETDGKGRKASNVCRVRAVFADFDTATQGILERLRSDTMPPSIIVESSEGKFHAYWLIENLPREQFKAIQQSIARYWGSDPKVCDLPRVMRLPGFLHQKAAPQLVHLVEITGRRYGQELVDRYAPKAVAAATCNQLVRSDVMTPYAEAALKRACSAVASTIEGSRNDTLNREAFGVAQLVSGGEIPEALARQSLLTAAQSAGLGHTEAARTLRSAFSAGSSHPRTSASPALASQVVQGEKLHPSALVVVPLKDIMTADVEPVRYIVNPWIPRRHVTLCGGHGGEGKTLIALTITAHAACGISFADMEIEKSRVLFVSLEDEPNIVRLRLRKIIEAYKLPANEVLENLHLLDGTQTLTTLMTNGSGHNATPIFTPAYHELNAYALGMDMIFIDNSSNAFDGDENNRQVVRTFVHGLASIARRNNASIVLLAHVDKAAARGGANGNNYSGSTAWHNTCRSRLAIIKKNGGTVIAHEKANLGVKAEPISLVFVDGVPMPEFSAKNTGHSAEEFDREEIIRAMRAAPDAGITVPASVTPGAHSAMKALESLPEYARAFRGRQGSQRAARAITALIRSGDIMRVEYKSPQRKIRERLVLTKDLDMN